MTTDTVARWEAWPVGALVAAAGLNTALWYAGPTLPGPVAWALPWLTAAAAVASVIAIDGSLVATIAGMRAGRRSRWSAANIVVSAVFTGLAALAAHTLPTIGPWLHGLFALTIVTYAMHLAQPKTTAVNAMVDSLQAELTQTRIQLAQALAARATEVSTPVKQLTAGGDDRKARVKALVDTGATKADAARAVGVSRQTVDKWMRGG